jgi:nucleotide-binding universal stress UspA family protein
MEDAAARRLARFGKHRVVNLLGAKKMTLSYKRVLNPIDFDEHSIKATPVAAELARYSAGKMFLLHVVPMTLEHRGLSTTVDSHRSQGAGARTRLEEIARVHAEGTSYDLLTRLGDPTQEILKAAKQLAADVIVMTTHGRKGLSRVAHGSVAENVMRDAACPVLVAITYLAARQ